MQSITQQITDNGYKFYKQSHLYPLYMTDMLYQKACEDVKGRRMQGNWKGSTYKTIRAKAMVNYLGVKLHRINIKGMTLKKLLTWTDQDVTYIVTTTGHVQVVKGKMIADQCGVVNAEDYWGIRKKVKEVLIVEKIG